MRGQMPMVDAAIYIAVQILAGIVAGIMYWAVLGATFTLAPGPGYSATDAVICEVFFTCALVFVVLNVATTVQDMNNHYYGLAIGLTVMSAAFAIGSISGCSLNPAVTVGVMLSHAMFAGGGLKYILHYIFAPLVGAALAAGIFRVVRGAEFRKANQA